ncbi:putative transcriptional regulatory protein TetR family [Bradyrhizobium cosmicum]|uniref:Transcriptional regulatory protein TetR family n=1 Tax=Bradyrhizobium cosmicum TaxID=1404864 RepID=A0AAI8MFF9_9BRAD|nr:putative transcriptional regulatory protein TetR family [Bradyrhizobium cosmicum]
MFGGGAPAPGPAWGLGGKDSCACAGTASNAMAETKGMMIFMRLDALMRAGPPTLSIAMVPCAIDDSLRAGLMPADITDLLWSAKSRYK